MLRCQVDRAAVSGNQVRLDPVIGTVERDDHAAGSDLMVHQLDQHFLEDIQHGAFPYGTEFSLKDVLVGKLQDDLLEKVKLIRDKGVFIDKIILIPVQRKGDGIIRKTK